jgi:hypothetical protein
MGRRSRRRRGGSGDACRGGSSAAATTRGAKKQVRARERRKEEKSDFASSMGHNDEGIRATGRLEAAHAADGHRRRTVTVCGVVRARERVTGASG